MMKLRCSLALLLAVSALRASAQEPQDEVAKLKTRIDKLEAENAAIKKEFAELKAQLTALRKDSSQKPPAPNTEDDKVKKVVENFLEDLQKGRLTSAYRDTSAAFQKQTDRKAFDELIQKQHGITNPPQSEYKCRKLSKDGGFEVYVTSLVPFVVPYNLTVRLIEEEGVWKVNEWEWKTKLGKLP